MSAPTRLRRRHRVRVERAGAGSPARSSARLDAGETLVELMLTITIMGIGVASVLFGLGTAIDLSARNRGYANAGTVLVSSADSVKSQTYVACPAVTTSSYDPDLNVTLPTGWAATDLVVTKVQKWNGISFQDGCPATDQKLQKVTITASAPDDRSIESIDVVLRSKS